MLLRSAALLLAAATAFAQTPLFNAKNLDGWWWSTDPNPPAPSWAVENGTLRTTPDAGTPVYLLTRDSFGDFEFSFEWKAAAGANSGIKYRFQGYWIEGKVLERPAGPKRIEPVGLEYQITDDEGNKDALSTPTHSTAAIYEYWPAAKSAPARAGVWHSGKIVARGLHIEHWLDGQKVVDVDLGAPELQQSFARSQRRGSAPLLAKHTRRDSPVALQIHDGAVWFRNLKIKRL